MKKIKILHIIKSLGRGGAEMLLPESLKLHDKSRFDFFYIYFLPWKDQMVEEILNAGGIVQCFSADNNLGLIKHYTGVIEFCRKNKIDLIHCHLPWAGFLGRLIYSKTNIPVLYSEHNMQDRYHFVTKNINRLSFNSQSMALGVSEDVSKSIKDNIHPSIPVKTLLNGVNTDTFQKNRGAGLKIRKDFGIPENAIVIGNVAVFRFQKRLEEWLLVFKEILRSGKNVYGIIVGAGQLENEVKTNLKNLDLEEKVFLPGLQTEVKPYLSAMDIFMMSSSFEGLPIALLEAMSMECAIVSTDAGGIKEVIRNDVDGLTCKAEDWKELSGLCMKLIEDTDKLFKLKIAARERVVQSFSLDKMVRSLESTYEKLNSKVTGVT